MKKIIINTKKSTKIKINRLSSHDYYNGNSGSNGTNSNINVGKAISMLERGDIFFLKILCFPNSFHQLFFISKRAHFSFIFIISLHSLIHLHIIFL
jgi:hypothetical protein